MRFGKKLKNTTYPPWKSHYIDYPKLKGLLREKDNGDGEGGEDEWTADDETAFVEELVNVQLEKVNAFQVETFKQLRQRTSQSEAKLEKLVPKGTVDDTKAESREGPEEISEDERQKGLKAVLSELDDITRETNELEKFSRINFTGFLKAVKKHDRKRGLSYKVRPLLQVRLAALPFNSEDYSPLLYRLSTMYSFVRQNIDGTKERRSLSAENDQAGGESFTSHKFWVHSDNVLEVKTYILRRLPVLVYNPQTSKIAEGAGTDPTITSLYFDSPKFSLYTRKVERAPDASSLRLRWYGQLSQKPEIVLEKKTITDGDRSEETRFPIKDKYIRPFIKGEYKMEKSVHKLQEREGPISKGSEHLENSVDEIQSFIKENELQPVLRANYTRTAFQIPGDSRVRISLDTDLALIREDSLDVDRPCRDPEDWHRTDIDSGEMEYPFSAIKKGEITRFPHALLEIRVRDGASRRSSEWLSDLMSTHLVKEAPRFSKFVHGVAHLFEDQVNSFPFWLSDLEQDIRKDPETAFEEEQEKKAKRAEDEFAIGSLIGSKGSSVYKPAVGSPVGKSYMQSASVKRASDEHGRTPISSPERRHASTRAGETAGEHDSDDDGVQGSHDQPKQSQGTASTLRNLLPSFSTSKYARARARRAGPGNVQLPPGVRHPGPAMKDSGPVKVEAKVWLANQRTFIKWQHVSVLLAGLSLGLYNAAGAHNTVARTLAIVYIVIAVFTGAWGWAIYMWRSKLISQRSGRDFDNAIGPTVVCISLLVALILNFWFKLGGALDFRQGP
ncbi:MAG: hypothetical protein M4579_005396 [Chaenotheca gracillima]|nr:MAG: hypothetical protein M4579_005396 [Chaenotheca gracillima]